MPFSRPRGHAGGQALRRSACLLTAAGLLVVSAPAALAAPGDPLVVGAGDLHGWGTYVEGTATNDLVDGPGRPPLGDGSLHFLTGSGTGSGQGGKNYAGTSTLAGAALDEVEELSYDTWVDHVQSRLAPVLDLKVDLDGDRLRDTTLVFEPVYQTEQPVAAQVWQHWDAAHGFFRSSKAVQGLITEGAPYTLAGLAAAYPDARIVDWYARPDGKSLVLGAGQSSGEIWAGFDGNVDNVRVARTGGSDTTYDFERGADPCSTDCYVNPDPALGDDVNSGANPAEAKRTIQAGVDAVQAGGTVHLADGTYPDRAKVGKALTLVGESRSGTVLQGGLVPGEMLGNGITITAPDVTVRRLSVKGQQQGVQLTGNDADGARLEQLTLSGNAQHGILSENFDLDGLTVTDVLAENNTASNGRGIYVSNGDKSGLRITDSTFRGNGLVGIDVGEGSVTGLDLERNTLSGNGDAGISVLNVTGTGNTIAGNDLLDNDRFGIEVKGSPGTVAITGNTVRRTTAPTKTADQAGIAVEQRGGGLPQNAKIMGNTVTGIRHRANSAGDGFGIVVEGTGHVVSGNTVTGSDIGVQVQGGGRATADDDFFDRGNAPVGSAAVNGNRLTGNGTGVRVVGAASGPASDGVGISGNTIRENEVGIDVRSPAGGATGATTAHFNAIVGNSATGLQAVDQAGVSATNNWWGCNAGPSAAACDSAAGGVTTAPWLVLRAALGDDTLVKGQTTTLTGDLRSNSGGAPAVGDYPDHGTVTFSGGALATVDPATRPLVDQAAATQLTAGTTAGSATASASYDGATAGVGYVVQDALTVSVGDVSANEGSVAGTTPFTFTVSLNRASERTETVAYRTVNGSAVAPSDYAARTGVLTFAPGQVSRTVVVNVVRDRTTEPTEAFTLQVVADARTTPAVADGTGVGTIVNDDAKPRVSVGDVGVAEGNVATTALRFPVRLDRPSSVPVTVRFTTATGTATSPSDFTATGGTITFAPGTTLQYATVQVKGDRIKEPNETFALNVFGPTQALLGDPNGSGVIRNDD